MTSQRNPSSHRTSITSLWSHTHAHYAFNQPEKKPKISNRQVIEESYAFREVGYNRRKVSTAVGSENVLVVQSITGGSWRWFPVPQQLLQCLVPFIRKAISKLLCLLRIWYSSTPHLWLGSFARGICLNHRTISSSVYAPTKRGRSELAHLASWLELAKHSSNSGYSGGRC